MHDTLTSRNWADFQQRYQGTYGWLSHNNKEIPVHIESVSSSQVTFKGLSGEEYFSYADKDVKFRFSPLRRRLIIGGKSGKLYYIARTPARQWSRGICDNNTRLTQLAPNGRMVQTGINSTTMADILTGESVEKSSLSGFDIVKLSDVFGVSGPYLWLYNQLIGTIDNGVITLSKEANIFSQELHDTLRDIKSTLKVK